MRKSIKLTLVPYLIFLSVLLAAIVGWILNIVTIFYSNFSVISGTLVLRVIGVFIPPIGAFMGWL